MLDAIFDSDKLKALASFQDLYVGLEPYQNPKLFAGGVLQSTAPAVFGLLAAIELHPTNDKAGGELQLSRTSGCASPAAVVFTSPVMVYGVVFAPIGGFQTVTNAMERLTQELGIKIQCSTTVTAVQNDGVHVRDKDGGRFLPGDLVIVNADFPYAKKSLIKNEKDAKDYLQTEPSTPTETYDWDDKFSFSSGVVSFHWSLDKSVDDLKTHNVFLMAESRAQAEASWQVLRPLKQQKDGDIGESPFNFYVHRPKATDPTAAPDGYDSIMVLVPCNGLLRDEECQKLPREEAMKKYRQQFAKDKIFEMKVAVLKRLGAIESLSDLKSHIIHEVVDTPASWADQFNLAAGTPFALVRLMKLQLFCCSKHLSLLSISRISKEPRICAAECHPAGTPIFWLVKRPVLRCQHQTRKWSTTGADWSKTSC